MGEWMRTPYDWADDVKHAARCPVMLVYGDSDMFRPEHIVEFYHLLGGGLKDAGWQREHMSQNRLAILPDVTHYEMAAVAGAGADGAAVPERQERDGGFGEARRVIYGV